MYIIKNALRNVFRNKGRNILIGIITLVIAISGCLALSINQAAETAKETGLDDELISANISVDYTAIQEQLSSESESSEEGGMDMAALREAMQEYTGLTLEEMETYANSDSVEDFQYTVSVSLAAIDDGIQPYTTSENENNNSGFVDRTIEGGEITVEVPTIVEGSGGGAGGAGGPGGTGGESNFSIGSEQRTYRADDQTINFFSGNSSLSDFSITGYSGELVMSDFTDGTNTLTDGELFNFDESNNEALISESLANLNEISVGDTITLANPTAINQTYQLTVVGIYTINSTDMATSFSSSQDPVNQIYVNSLTAQSIVDDSTTNATTYQDANGEDQSTVLTASTEGNYYFNSVDNYNSFVEETQNLGLDSAYQVSSSDLTAFLESLVPLDTLSQFATIFFWIMVAIGAIILVVLNMFSIRERKYEVGVLTAIGQKKSKVAFQFILETFVITFIAIAIGTAIGAVASVPVTNTLLATMVEAQEETLATQEQNFGRSGGNDSTQLISPESSGETDSVTENITDSTADNTTDETTTDSTTTLTEDETIADTTGDTNTNQIISEENQVSQYLSEVTSATDLKVVAYLMGLGILLTIVSSLVAMIFIMRFEPLKILQNRN